MIGGAFSAWLLIALLPDSGAQSAEALARRALAAHGSMAPIRAAPGIEIRLEGRYDLAARVQGRSFTGREWTPISERISIDMATGRVAYDADFYNYAFSNQRLREVHDSGPLFIDLRAGEGNYLPFTLTDDAKDRYRRYLPQFLLEEALAGRRTLELEPDAEFRGCDAHSFSYATAAGHRLRVYVDRASGVVCGASAPIAMPVLGDTRIDYRWEAYRTVGTARVPGRFRSWLAGRVLKEARMHVRFDADRAAFLPPDGVTVGDPPAELRRLADAAPYGERPANVETLAPGVFMVRGLRPGFRVPFFEFEDFVLAVDAPTGYHDIQQIPPLWGSPGDSVDALGEKYVRAIRATVPDKPIRYLALTHHHGDHVGGLRPFAAAGATLVGTAPVIAAARHALGASAGPGRVAGAAAETFAGQTTIADGAMEVRLIELPAGNPKAEGFTLVYLPRHRLLYSTAFIYPVAEGSEPPPESVDLALWLLDWLDRSGLEVERHYNVHAGGLIEERHIEQLRRIARERAGG